MIKKELLEKQGVIDDFTKGEFKCTKRELDDDKKLSDFVKYLCDQSNFEYDNICRIEFDDYYKGLTVVFDCELFNIVVFDVEI